MLGKFKTIVRSMPRLLIRPNCHVAVLTVKGLTGRSEGYYSCVYFSVRNRYDRGYRIKRIMQ